MERRKVRPFGRFRWELEWRTWTRQPTLVGVIDIWITCEESQRTVCFDTLKGCVFRRRSILKCLSVMTNLHLNQLHLVLHPIFQLDWPVPMVLLPRGPHLCIDSCIDLYPNGTLVVVEPGACAAYQWSLFFRDPPLHLCRLGKQPFTGRWPRGSRVIAHRYHRQNECSTRNFA